MTFQTRPSRVPFLNAPAVVLWLIGVLLAAHAARVFVPMPIGDDVIGMFAFIPERYAALAQGSLGLRDVFDLIAPFFGYIFLHGSFTHVGVNCLWLLAFGPVVARRLSAVEFLLFFLLCGVAAAVTHLALYWGSSLPVVGASGAIAGLMAAAMRIFYGGYYGKALAPVDSRPIIGFSAIWVIGNIVTGIIGVGITDGATDVAWVAHLGGYFAGLFGIGWFKGATSSRWRIV